MSRFLGGADSNSTIVIGMVHLPPLPGAPGFGGDVEQVSTQSLEDAQQLAEGGVDALMLENYHDTPFYPGSVPPITVAHMSVLASRIRQTVDLPLGINLLRNDGPGALAVAHAAGAEFIRVNVLAGVRVCDQGLVEGMAHHLLRERRNLAADSIRILADLDVKHSAPLARRPLAEEAADLATRGGADGLIVSGSATGSPTSLDDLREARQGCGSLPLLVGSGVNRDNIEKLAPLADGLIIGTAFQTDGRPKAPQVRKLLARL